MRLNIPGIVLSAIVSVYPISRVLAADPQSYRVDMASTGNAALDDTLRATSELISLRGAAPVSAFGLIARARAEGDRLKTVLESYGYYESTSSVTIEGLSLKSGALPDALNALPKDAVAKVEIAFTLGPLYHLRDVKIEGTLPRSAVGALSLKTGSPAVAADVLGAGSRLLTTLQEQGYAFAKVDAPVAFEDASEPVLDLSFHVDAGAQVRIGAIRLEGLQRVHERFVRRRLLLKSGQRYSPSAIDAARRDLLGLGPVAAVSVKVGTTVDDTGGVPVTFTIRERLRHAVNLSTAYSTDLGGSGGIAWSDRNVFGNAEQLDIRASLINLGGSATTGIGYDTSAKLTIPDVGHRDQSLQFSLEAIKQSLQAYDQEAVTSGVTLSRKLSSVWTASVGISSAHERITQEMVNYNYTLVSLPLTLNYDSTHLASPLDDPLHGMRDSFSVTPIRALGHPDASFVISQIKLAAYLDLTVLGFSKPGRSVIAVRGLAGVAQGAGEFSLPPDQRFYGGGSGTIRGYRYQAVGPQFVDGNPAGGTAIQAATVEWRQRFGTNLGGAVFVDGGRVSTNLKTLPTDFTTGSEFRVGVGLGIRYYSPIGPIRFDIALPTRRYSSDDDAFEIYIGLGQAF